MTRKTLRGGRMLAAVLALAPLTDAALARSGRPEVVPFGTLPSVEKLAYYDELGCTEVVLRLPAADRDTVLRALDRHVETCTASGHL